MINTITRPKQEVVNIYSSQYKSIIHHTTNDSITTYYCNTIDPISNGNRVVAMIKVNGKSVLIDGKVTFHKEFTIIDTGLSKLYYANDMIKIVGKVERLFTRKAIKN